MFQHLSMRRTQLRRAVPLAVIFISALAAAAFDARAADLPDDPSNQADTLAHAHPFNESTVAGGAPLSIVDASALALSEQPRLREREAAIAADEQLAVSAAQLPDPKLIAGVKDLPVDSNEAFSVRDDNFTMFSVGLSQDFPRADKRRLKAERKRLDAVAGRFGLDDGRREISRDAALAWLDVFEAEHALALAQELAKESTLQLQSQDSDYRTGRASQADWLAAKVAVGLADDQAQDWRHRSERLRAALSRWIGDEALRPLAGDLVAIAAPVDFPQLNAAVERHPMVAGFDTQIAASDTEVKLARQAYKSDFSVEGYFGYRPAYADFAGVQVSMDLPIFTANRQDRELAAALRQSDAAHDRKADALRELHAQATEDYIDWHHDRARAATFERDIIPDAARRIDAAQSAYAAGRGGFDAVLAARRSLLDTKLQALALTVDAARAQIRLQYFTAAAGVAP